MVQGGKLHWGVNYTGNSWTTPDQAYWPTGSYLFNGSGPAVETPLIGPSQDSTLTIKLGPFNNPAQTVESVAFVIHYDSNTWDNNNGADYHIQIDDLGIESELMVGEKLLLYPNPASSELSIKIVNRRILGDAYYVEILDVHGRVVHSSKLSLVKNINVSDLEAGVYFVRVRGNDAKMDFVERMVIVE